MLNSSKELKIKKPLFKRKRIIIPLLSILVVIFADLFIVFATHGSNKKIDIHILDNNTNSIDSNHLTLLTLNMAHGRSDGKSQLFQSNDVIEQNVNAIGKFISNEKAHVVALQEADGPSWWSGDFSHVKRVGALGKMSAAVQGSNVSGLGLSYGTALVTQLKVSDAQQITFEKNAPTFSKGFVVATCKWPGSPDFEFNVVSLHLDFASNNVRVRQLAILTDYIKKSSKPVIIMGDFNSDMSSSLLANFMSNLALKTWKQNDTSIVTFPKLKTRIDWIFVSREFQIIEQYVLNEVLSDHRAVKAIIARSE